MKLILPWLCLLFPVAVAPAANPWGWLNRTLPRLEKDKQRLESSLRALPPQPASQAHETAGFHSGFAPGADSLRWVQVDLGEERPIDSVVVIPAFLGGTQAYGFPLRFRVDISHDAAFAESVTLLDHTASDRPAVMAPVHLRGEGKGARYVRFTASRLAVPQGSRAFFCLGELLVFSKGANVAARAPVTSSRAVDSPPTWSLRNLVDGVSALGLPLASAPALTNGWHSAIYPQAEVTSWVQVDLGHSFPLEEVRLIPARPPDFPDRTGFGFPRNFKVEVSEDAAFISPQLILDSAGVPFANPGDNPVPLPAHGVAGRYVRITATRLWERSGDFVFALGEMQVLAEGRNLAAGSQVTASDDTLTTSWQREWLVDGLTGGGSLLDWEEWLQKLSLRQDLEQLLGTLDQEIAAARSLAQRRGAWAALALAMLLGMAALVFWLRARRARKRELETLRQRIARDLHDEVGSHLGSICLASELALRDSGADAQEALDEIHRMARQAADSMRGIVWLVREGGEPPLERLVEALRESASTQLQSLPWEFQEEGAGKGLAMSLDFHRHVFLFFKEAVYNAARHSGASKVVIHVQWTYDRFQLKIIDNGRGFDPETQSGGSGMANLRHRATALKGELNLASIPAQGTSITLTAPLRSA